MWAYAHAGFHKNNIFNDSNIFYRINRIFGINDDVYKFWNWNLIDIKYMLLLFCRHFRWQDLRMFCFYFRCQFIFRIFAGQPPPVFPDVLKKGQCHQCDNGEGGDAADDGDGLEGTDAADHQQGNADNANTQ